MSQKDETWTARVPSFVKEYLQNEKGLSAGKCLVMIFKILKEKELPAAEQELTRRREAVVQQEQLVTQLRNECVTKQQIVTQSKQAKIEQMLRDAFDPKYFIGKEIEGIAITKEMVDKAVGLSKNESNSS